MTYFNFNANFGNHRDGFKLITLNGVVKELLFCYVSSYLECPLGHISFDGLDLFVCTRWTENPEFLGMF